MQKLGVPKLSDSVADVGHKETMSSIWRTLSGTSAEETFEAAYYARSRERTEDVAGYVYKYSPTVKTARSHGLRGESLAESVLAAQEVMGVRRDRQRILSREELSDFSRDLQGVLRQQDVGGVVTFIEGVRDLYGVYGGRVLGELRRYGGRFTWLEAYERFGGEDLVFRDGLRGMLSYEKLDSVLDTDTRARYLEGLTQTLEPYLSALLHLDGGRDRVGFWLRFTESALLMRVSEGGGIESTLGEVSSLVLGDKTYIRNVDGSTWGLSRGYDVDAVAGGLTDKLKDIEDGRLELALPRDLPAETSQTVNKTLRQRILSRPVFVSTEDDSGLYLYFEGLKGRVWPVLDVKGDRIRASFAELQERGRTVISHP